MPIGKDNKRVVYYYDEEIGNFYYGLYHPMKPQRVRMVHSLVVGYGLFKKMEVFRPYRLDDREMTKFHSDDYVHFLKTVSPDNRDSWGSELEKFNIDQDCPVFDGLYRFCQLSCGGSVGGGYKLNHGLADIAINWAGGLHHAKKSEASGFCYLNDIVLGILELLKFHERVLYIDVDIHHGDGVEEAFYTSNRVMTVSLHKFGDFFPGTGAVDDKGIGNGENYSINVPLEEGIDDDSFQYVFKPLINEVMQRFAPSAVVIQLGADSLAGDKLGCFNMTIRGHGECLEYVRSFNLPLLVLGGGGYTLRNVARCWSHETAICCGVELEDRIPYHDYYEYFAPTYTLSTTPTNVVNCNKRSTLDASRRTVTEYLRQLTAVPSVEMHSRANDFLPYAELDKWKADVADDIRLDDRLPQHLKDRLKESALEFYDGDDDNDKDTHTDEAMAADTPKADKAQKQVDVVMTDGSLLKTTLATTSSSQTTAEAMAAKTDSLSPKKKEVVWVHTTTQLDSQSPAEVRPSPPKPSASDGGTAPITEKTAVETTAETTAADTTAADTTTTVESTSKTEESTEKSTAVKSQSAAVVAKDSDFTVKSETENVAPSLPTPAADSGVEATAKEQVDVVVQSDAAESGGAQE